MRYTRHILIILSILLTGCASEEEKEARRQNAFDISGTYTTTEDSEVQLSFTITSQNVKHDIFVQVNRTSPLSDKEKEFLSKEAEEHGIPLETLTSQAFPTAFGGEDAWLDEIIDGGENISTDFGKTSDFSICSDNPPEYESKKVEEGVKNIKLRIFYCFSGTVKKENKNRIENGVLTLRSSYSFEHTDETKGFGVTSALEGADLSYKAEKATSACDSTLNPDCPASSSSLN